MTTADTSFFTFQYVTGQRRASHAELLANFETRSVEAVENYLAKIDVAYGPHPRQKMDVFYTKERVRGSILYFHPGYWQSRDKSTFRFLANSVLPIGYNLVLANYPLCPDVHLHELVEHAALSIPFTLEYLGSAHPADQGLIVAGHSAGGHLAVEMALRSWPLISHTARPVSKIIAISGIFDLSPLIFTPLNDKLLLSSQEAISRSPIHRIRRVDIPAFFIVGGDETDEFRLQSRNISDRWQNAGNGSSYFEMPGADHFSVVADLQPSLISAFADNAGS